jgi:Flp pilus assembly protein TadG
MAAVLLLLCVITLGTIDFGRVFFMAIALTNSARAGAQYGAQSSAKSQDTAGMTTAALNSGSCDLGGSSSSGCVSGGTSAWIRNAGRRCECDGTIQSCTASCGGTTRIYVTVTVSKLFTLISGFPGLPNNISIQRAVQLRAQ